MKKIDYNTIAFLFCTVVIALIIIGACLKEMF